MIPDKTVQLRDRDFAVQKQTDTMKYFPDVFSMFYLFYKSHVNQYESSITMK